MYSEKKTERLGIVIVHFGYQSRTVRCLDSFVSAISWLKEYIPTVKTSILIVDNSGNLNLANCRHYHDAKVRYFRPKINLGYAGACYLATKLLKDASILIFSNNDIILREDALLYLLETLKSLPDAGAIQPLTLVNGTSKVDSSGLACNSIMHGFNYSNWPIKPLDRFFLKNGLEVMECFGVDGMLLALKRKVWDEVGGWDPNFFMFNEDNLLSWKLRLKGYRNYVALNSVAFHERGGTAEGYFLKKNPIFPSYYISRNKILSVLYIYEGLWLIVYFFISVLFEFAKSVWLSLWRKSALYVYYYFRAIIFILRSHKYVVSERARVIRKLNPREFIKRGYVIPILISLAWLFHARSKILNHSHMLKFKQVKPEDID